MVGWTIVMAGLVPAISFLKTLRDGTGIAGTTPGDDGLERLLLLLLKICLDRAAELDRQWIAVAVLGLADFDPNPALRKAILLDVRLLDALEAYPYVMLKNFGLVIGAMRVVREPIWWLVWHRILRGRPFCRHWGKSLRFGEVCSYIGGEAAYLVPRAHWVAFYRASGTV